MAERRRALGRGLEALMPAAQAEPLGRPTDVFFPEGSRRRQAAYERVTESGGQEAGGEYSASGISSGGSRSTSDLAAKLLAPSKRTAKHPKKSAARKSRSAVVSREISSAAGLETTEDSLSHTVQVPQETAEPASRTSSTGASTSGTAPSAAQAASVSAEGIDASTSAQADVREMASAPVPDKDSTPVVSRETDADGEGLVPVPGATFGHIPLDRIDANPRQPRQFFDEEDIEELAASIREVGLLQPVVVRRAPGSDDDDPHYELIMGERRTRAARVAGLETIPAIVRYTDDQDLLRDALLENLHRVQLNPLEEAAAYKALLEDFGCTHAELSKRIARSRSQISNTLRLMKLPALVQRRVAAGVLSAGHARALLGLPDAGAMERLAQRIVAEGISVRVTEELVAMHDEPQVSDESLPHPQRVRSTALPALSTRLSDAFETRVKVTRTARKGKITIEFAGDEDLARIVDALAPGTSLSED